MSHQAVHESEITKNAVVKGQVLIVCTNANKLKDIETGLWWVWRVPFRLHSRCCCHPCTCPRVVTVGIWQAIAGFGVMIDSA
jgi:hypothetical protein